MTQDNAPTDPPSDLPHSDPSLPSSAGAPTGRSSGKKNAGEGTGGTKKRRPWIRRILLGAVVLVVLLLLLVALTPTLLSTGAGRTFVLGKVNENLNGHVMIADWSIGWTSGIHVNGVKVFDDTDRQILQIPHFSTQLSLLSAIRGNIHLGNTTIEGLDFLAERDEKGVLNFSRLAKSSTSPSKKEDHSSEQKESKLPTVDGEIHLVGCGGTFVDAKSSKPVKFTTIAGDIKIPDINSPIEDSLKLVAQIDGHELSSFAMDGKLQIASNNVLLDPNKMVGQQKFTGNVDPVLAEMGFGSALAEQQLAFRSGAVGLSGSLDADGQKAVVSTTFTINKLTLEKGTGPTAKKVLDNYTMTVGADATYAASSGTTHISVSRLIVAEQPAQPDALVNVSLNGGKPIQIDSTPDGKIQGSGAVSIEANLARINEVVRAFNSGAEVAATTSEGARVTSGLLNGTLNFGSDQQQLAVDGDFKVTALTVAVPDAEGLKNEQVELAVSARMAQNFATATVPKLDVTGSVLTVNGSDIQLKLKDGPDGKSVPAMQMIRHALVVMNIPAVEKLQELEDSFLPPPAKTAAPAKVALVSVDPLAAQYALAKATPAPAKPAEPEPAPPVKLAKGSVLTKIEVVGDQYGTTAAISVQGAGIVLSKDAVPDNIGDLIVDGKVAVAAGASSAVSTVIFNNLRVQAVGSAVILNGSLEDLENARNFKNVTADLTYNSGMLWNAILPMLSKDQQVKLKDAKVSGNYTRKFTVNGSYPANKPMNEAIVSLTADGEFVLDLFDGEGATLKGLVIPIWLEGGKFKIAYKGKPAGQEFAAPAHLNDGNFTLAGTTLDLTPVHPLLTIPDGTKMLDNVALNPLFARTFLSGWLSNPVFAGADKATGTVFVTVKHCADLPADAFVLESAPENKGVMDMNLVMTHVELGSKFINSLNSALALINPKGRVASGGLLINIPSFAVHIEHGITTEDMKLEIGKNPPMQMAGNVVMKTDALQNMAIAIPITKEQSVKLPITGTVQSPTLDTGGLLKQNLNIIPGVKDLFGKDKNGSTQPSDNPEKGAEDLLGNLLKPKDKKKDGQDGNGK